MALSGFEQEVGLIYDYYGDLFPNAIMRPSDELDIEEELRLRSAGLGMARINNDGEIFMATYVREPDHPAVIALNGIWAAETHGLIPEGRHDETIDRLVLGLPNVLDEYITRQLD